MKPSLQKLASFPRLSTAELVKRESILIGCFRSTAAQNGFPLSRE
jgi:hypothetical protein